MRIMLVPGVYLARPGRMRIRGEELQPDTSESFSRSVHTSFPDG